MSDATLKYVLSVVGVVLTGLSFVPQLTPYAPALTFVGGALGGGAWIPRPGDARKVQP
jgi:hypothetical protein